MATSTEISFGLFDVSAKPDSSPSCPDKQPFVDIDQLKLDAVTALPAATLEPNYWLLDGSRVAFPDEPETKTWGLWSESMSGADGAFAAPPVLKVEFTGNHSSMGISFEFDPHGNNHPSHINIKWYNGTTLLADEDFHPDSWQYSALKTVENYDKLVITFFSMSVPYRYLKLQKINYGVLRNFGTDEVIEAGILEEINPISAELSINTLNFRLHSPDAEFNILNPQGIYTLLQQRQPLVVTERVDGTDKPMGTFFLDEWENQTENTFRMAAMDAIGIMDGTTYKGGMVNDDAAAIMAAILDDAGFGYDIDSSYASVNVSGWLPISSHREALQQVAFAVGAVVDTSRGDIVRVYPLSGATAGTITKDRRFTGGGVKMRGLVTGVEVTAHNYVAGSEAIELFNGSLAAGQYEITFSEPAHSLSISGATITASNCNYARVNVAASGDVTLTGKRYVDTTQVYGVYMGTLPAGSKENILKVEEATLVSGNNAQDVAQRVYDYYQRRIEQTVSMVLDTEQVGQTVEVETLYNELRAGTIESLETDLTGGCVAKAVIVGE